MKILLVKTSSMGDVLHTLPALTDALLAIPNLTVDWVVEENFAQIPIWHSAVRQVFPVALRRWRKSWFSQSVKLERKQFFQAIQAEEYDVIIDAQGLIKSAFLIVRHARSLRNSKNLCSLTNQPNLPNIKTGKHGYNWKSAREGLASLCYDHKHAVAWQQHAVERIRELFAKSLGYEKPNTVGDYDIAQHFLNIPPSELNTLNSSPYLIFLHSTTRDEKHWPEAHWIELITLLENSTLHNFTIKLPWGTEQEKARAERLAKTSKHVEVLPKLTLAEIAHEIAHAQAVVSVDTGLSHLTAALSKPNITLFGPTDPKLIGGYGINQHVLKSPTQNLHYLSANSVYQRLSEVLYGLL